jgi:hypothetical protein
MMKDGREAAAFRAAVAGALAASRSRDAGPWRLIQLDTGVELFAEVAIAATFWPRFRGWMWRRPAGPSEALLLAPCRGIHTHGMRFAIDAAFVDEHGYVLTVVHGLAPWRFHRGVASAYAVIEAAAGGPLSRVTPGTQLGLASEKPASTTWMSG